MQLRGAQGGEGGPQVRPAHLGDKNKLKVKAAALHSPSLGRVCLLSALGAEAEGQASWPRVPSQHADPCCPYRMARSAGGGVTGRRSTAAPQGQLTPSRLVDIQAESRMGGRSRRGQGLAH